VRARSASGRGDGSTPTIPRSPGSRKDVAQRDDRLYIISTAPHTGFDFVVDVKGQVVRLTVAPEDLIFDRPGKIWFEGDVGPFSVPPKASDLARPGWSAFVTAAKAAGRWHLLEVGAVYP
jgi:hypothetical protein